MSKQWWVVVGLASAGLLAWLSSSWTTQASHSGAWPVSKVALAQATYQQAPRRLSGVGELEASQQVQLATEVPGQVVQIGFESGQSVQAGQVLVQLNDAVEQAELVRLQAQLRNAETLLARTQRLLQEKAATREQLDQAIAERDGLRAEVVKTRAQIAQKAIRAPFAGTVGVRRVHLGQYLQAGQAVANLVDAQHMHVNFSLAEQAMAQLQPGLPVAVRVDAYPDQVFTAEIRAVDPLVASSRTLWVQAVLANENGRLRAGSFAAVSVAMPDQAPVLAIPESAVSYAAYGETVFVAQQQAAHGWAVRRVSVKTGERWDGKIEIVSGLSEGEHVVVSGQMKLGDGMPVEPVSEDTLATSAANDAQEPTP